ncbi:family 43 glycosylhydrolase [Nocardioides daeguensis]|uniref:Glycoside hydrolase n=1 Tax=Nocardioides daeguensis TaxID=908359 RepID=A0ABP6V5X4_9ACTN|nr:family 43 glycosylhydrolase [Nocardioides daeguensis]MBV6726348.1 family 43 glycosylhydrolase [Nocardioides daeguensis]MCR1772191.1 family 43 glycosylhydrolase [Nocardioides daeguensis]
MPRSAPRLACCLAVLAALVLTLCGTPARADDDPAKRYPEPFFNGNVGDPSVAMVGKRMVVVATGPQVNRAYKDPGRPWRYQQPVLTHRPRWAIADGGIWAADLAKVGRRWVLYYAVPVAGLGDFGRCIGVAVAKRPLDAFRPVGRRPLVCPSRALVPPARDPVVTPDLPSRGIIDPSLYREGKQNYLLYKTDGRPSSIRLLPLSRDGRKVRPGQDPANPSVELVRSEGVIENPVLTRHDGQYYLFASEGDFARCSYAQTWRQSASLTDWSLAVSTVLLDSTVTQGLCGPAGGDILQHRGRTTLYFHGWVRLHSSKPKGADYWAWNGGEKYGRRAMYAARLSFPGGVPTVKKYLTRTGVPARVPAPY